MKRILKINETPLLNFISLKNEFLPLPLYNDISLFSEFSKIHCCGFPIILSDNDGKKYPAKYFNKNFWQSVIETKEWKNESNNVFKVLKTLIQEKFSEDFYDNNYINGIIKCNDIDKLTDKDFRQKTLDEVKYLIDKFLSKIFVQNDKDNNEEIIDIFINKIFIRDNNKTEENKDKKEAEDNIINKFTLGIVELKKEYVDSKIKDKILFIQENANSKDDPRKTLLLLAICELSEINVLKTEPAIWKPSNNSLNEQNELKDTSPADFPYINNLSVLCGNHTYRYWYYDDDKLNANEKIRTVKIEAKKNGTSNSASIEIYSEKQNRCIQNIKLNAGDFLYVNAAGNRIIKVLPKVFISDDTCIIKNRDILNIIPENHEDYTTSCKNVSSVAVDLYNNGFLMVANGKILSHFCKSILSDYMTKLKISSIIKPVVELRTIDLGFEILLEDGTVLYSNFDNKKTGVISLGDRAVPPEGYVEYAESYSKESKIQISKDNSKEIWFKSKKYKPL